MELPLFVKPNRSGSSFGVSRIESIEEFYEAFSAAQQEGNEVIVEEGINGIEVGCGVLQSYFDFEILDIAGTKDSSDCDYEIVPTDSSFFDYEAKYNGKVKKLHLPELIPNSRKNRRYIYSCI